MGLETSPAWIPGHAETIATNESDDSMVAIDGSDVHVNVTVTLYEAVFSKAFPFEYACQQVCKRCGGKGAFTVTLDMREHEVPCNRCHGHGTTTEKRAHEITPLAGDRDNTLMDFHFKGGGNCGISGGQPGDLYVRVWVEPDERFEVRGKDLICRVSKKAVTCPTSGQVQTITLPTLDGEPPGPGFSDIFISVFEFQEVQGAGGFQRGDKQRGNLIYRLTHHDPAKPVASPGSQNNAAPGNPDIMFETTKEEAVVAFATELFPALDSLEKAMATMTAPDEASHREGIELILDMQRQAMARHGIEVIHASGETFDPHVHEAVAVDKAARGPKNRVTDVLQTGYTHSGRLLRAALVKVSG